MSGIGMLRCVNSEELHYEDTSGEPCCGEVSEKVGSYWGFMRQVTCVACLKAIMERERDVYIRKAAIERLEELGESGCWTQYGWWIDEEKVR